VQALQDVEPAFERDRIVRDLERVVSAGPALERAEDAPHPLPPRRRQRAQVLRPGRRQTGKGRAAGDLERHLADVAQRFAQQGSHRIVAAQRLQIELVPGAEPVVLQQREQGARDLLLLTRGYDRAQVLGAHLVALGLAGAEQLEPRQPEGGAREQRQHAHQLGPAPEGDYPRLPPAQRPEDPPPAEHPQRAAHESIVVRACQQALPVGRERVERGRVGGELMVQH
jgi:hypothetical protein